MSDSSITPQGRWIHVDAATQSLRFLNMMAAKWTASVSTSAKGLGEEPNSYRTPRGWHRIREKIGDGAAIGTVFKARVPTGQIWKADAAPKEDEADLILTRILWLEGLEPENATTYDRYVYFHGTNQESRVGQPASHGCIRLRNEEMVQLYELARVGDLVLITE